LLFFPSSHPFFRQLGSGLEYRLLFWSTFPTFFLFSSPFFFLRDLRSPDLFSPNRGGRYEDAPPNTPVSVSFNGDISSRPRGFSRLRPFPSAVSSVPYVSHLLLVYCNPPFGILFHSFFAFKSGWTPPFFLQLPFFLRTFRHFHKRCFKISHF